MKPSQANVLWPEAIGPAPDEGAPDPAVVLQAHVEPLGPEVVGRPGHLQANVVGVEAILATTWKLSAPGYASADDGRQRWPAPRQGDEQRHDGYENDSELSYTVALLRYYGDLAGTPR